MVSGTPPVVAVGSSSMITTGTLALFAALWDMVLKKNKVQSEEDQIQDRNSKN